MKQAEHPPVTAGANSAAEYSLAIIDQLARIDRTCSKEEMDELVYRLLGLIGEAMQSDRVFLFERLEGTAEAYCNTFEWCANGVAPQIDNLTEIVPADMPYWLKVFGRGETIVIPNIEDVKTLMPSEYELLKAQSIRSEIAVPVFYRGNLSGFFGLDNPQRAMTAGQLRLLAFDGGHLGSARENLRMLTLLEEKQKSLEQNLQAVKLEQQMLKVLCKDSTSVYREDLMNDRAEIVKIEEHSNSAGDLLPHGQELFSYPVKDGNWHLARFIVQTRGKWRSGAGALCDAPLQRRKAPRKGPDERGRCGAPRERGKVRVPLVHVARYPHADECHHGLYEHRPTARGRFG